MLLGTISSCDTGEIAVKPIQEPQAEINLSNEEVTSLMLLNENHEIPFEEIERQAQEVMDEFSVIGSQNGRTIQSLTPNFKRITRASTSSSNARVEEDSATLYYIVNFTDEASNPAGYTVISADERVPGIFTASMEGEVGDTLTDPGLIIFFGNLEGYVQREIESFNAKYDSLVLVALSKLGYTTDAGSDSVEESQSGRFILPKDGGDEEPEVACFVYTSSSYGSWSTAEQVGPFIEAMWGQESPYNDLVNEFCDGKRVKLGCGPTAVSQIFTYYQFPPAYGYDIYDWTKITNAINTVKAGARPLAIEEFEISQLCHVVGQSIGAEWDDCSKGTSTTTYDKNIDDGIDELGYTVSGPVDYSNGTVLDEIKTNQRPVLIGGNAIRERKGVWPIRWWDHSEGHYFIIDGYRKRKRQEIKTIELKDCEGNIISTSTYYNYQYKDYVHCNLGWSGSDNAWYVPGVFDTNNLVDSSLSGGRVKYEGTSWNYQFNLRIWTNIKPKY